MISQTCVLQAQASVPAVAAAVALAAAAAVIAAGVVAAAFVGAVVAVKEFADAVVEGFVGFETGEEWPLIQNSAVHDEEMLVALIVCAHPYIPAVVVIDVPEDVVEVVLYIGRRVVAVELANEGVLVSEAHYADYISLVVACRHIH